MNAEIKKGICENCPEEDFKDNNGQGNSHSKEQPLYKICGKLVCGDCASMWASDLEEMRAEN
jgi:hypothetical protein